MDCELLKESIIILQYANYIVLKIYQCSQGYSIAKGNIIWAENLLTKL